MNIIVLYGYTGNKHLSSRCKELTQLIDQPVYRKSPNTRGVRKIILIQTVESILLNHNCCLSVFLSV